MKQLRTQNWLYKYSTITPPLLPQHVTFAFEAPKNRLVRTERFVHKRTRFQRERRENKAASWYLRSLSSLLYPGTAGRGQQITAPSKGTCRASTSCCRRELTSATAIMTVLLLQQCFKCFNVIKSDTYFSPLMLFLLFVRLSRSSSPSTA